MLNEEQYEGGSFSSIREGGVMELFACSFFLSDLFGMSDSAIESTSVGRSLEPGPSF